MSFATATINDVGPISHRAAVSITTSPKEITIGSGKKTLEVFNIGTKLVYYGATGVDGDATGIPIFPNQKQSWHGVENGFIVFLVCAAGDSSTVRIVEYQ